MAEGGRGGQAKVKRRKVEGEAIWLAIKCHARPTYNVGGDESPETLGGRGRGGGGGLGINPESVQSSSYTQGVPRMKCTNTRDEWIESIHLAGTKYVHEYP